MGIAGLIGPGLFTLTFAAFIGTGTSMPIPGAPFFLAASLLVGATILSFQVTRSR
jgi:DHA1 family tetracycline resistance protein-like MFS transporter